MFYQCSRASTSVRLSESLEMVEKHSKDSKHINSLLDGFSAVWLLFDEWYFFVYDRWILQTCTIIPSSTVDLYTVCWLKSSLFRWCWLMTKQRSTWNFAWSCMRCRWPETSTNHSSWTIKIWLGQGKASETIANRPCQPNECGWSLGWSQKSPISF